MFMFSPPMPPQPGGGRRQRERRKRPLLLVYIHPIVSPIPQLLSSPSPTTTKNAPCKNSPRVSVWEATHWSKANALHTRLLAWAVKVGGESMG